MRIVFRRVSARLLKPKIGIPVLLVVLLLSAPFVLRGLRLAGLPDIGEPFDLAAAGTVQIDPADNAYVGYERATALLVSGNEEGLESALREGWAEAPPDLQKWVHDNRPAVEAFQVASAAADAVLVQPDAYSLETLGQVMAVLSPLRKFNRLSRLEALRQEASSDLAGAWQTLHAAFRASRHTGRHGCMIERLVGIANHAQTAAGILHWSQQAGVTRAQLSAALQDIRQADAMTPATHAMYQAEYFFVRTVLNDREHIWKTVSEKLPAMFGDFENLGLYVLAEPELSLRLAQRMAANCLAQCDRPRAARMPIRNGLFEPDPSLSADAQLFRPERMESFNYRMSCVADGECHLNGFALAEVLEAIDKERAQQAALELALLLQAFWRDHAEFPANLSELISAEFPRLPDDPFAKPGTSWNYRREGRRALLWSIGPDGVDNEGRISFNSESGIGDILTEVVAPNEPETPE